MRLTHRDDRGWHVIEVVGVVDVASAPDLRQALQEARFAGDSRLLVDLDGVELLDSFGLGVLVGALRRSRTDGGELALVVTRTRLLRLFEVTGLDGVFHLVDRPEAVLGT